MLTKLDVGSAMGSDGVHPRLLRECAVQLASPFTMIFKSSLMSGVFPGVWLESEVIPLFKAKSRYDAQNYRSVSLTSVYCKSMERILSAELMDYLENNSLLSDRQFGFRRSRSVEDQILLV